MAVTVQYSPEYNQDKQAPALASFDQGVYRLITLPFTFTQGSAAGDATSTMYLRSLPPGRILFFPHLSRIRWTAFGAARLLDVGFGPYTEPDGDVVATDANYYDDDVDVSAAGSAALGSDFGTQGNGGDAHELWSKEGVPVYATVAGGTIPALGTLIGFLTIGVL